MKKQILSVTILLATLAINANLLANELCYAVYNGDLKKAEEIIKKNKDLVNIPNKDGQTPLILACLNSLSAKSRVINGELKTIDKHCLEMTKLLLENGAKKSINVTDKDGNTPLLMACQDTVFNMPKVIKLLLDNGAIESINIANKYEDTTLISICHSRHPQTEIVKLFLNNGAKKTINKANKHGQTALFSAYMQENMDIANLLLKNGAKKSVNKATNDGKTLLYLACDYGNLKDAKYLINLDKKAKETINRATKNGRTPLYKACERNNLKIVELLLLNCTKETINKVDNYSFETTPLYWACKNNNLKIFELLLPSCTPETINKGGSQNNLTPLYWACRNNNLKMVKLLLPSCTPKTINKSHKNEGRSPLYWACKNNNLKMVALLIPHCTRETINKIVSRYCHGETPCYQKKTALDWACENNRRKMIDLLLPYCTAKTISRAIANYPIVKKQLSLKAPLLLLQAQLLQAYENNNLKRVKLLLPYCTKETIDKIRIQDTCARDNLEIVKPLIKKRIKKRRKGGRFSKTKRKAKVVKINEEELRKKIECIVKVDMYIKEMGQNGVKINKAKTLLLHTAFETGDFKLMEYLLDEDANIFTKDKNKKTVLHKSIEKKCPTITKLLLNKLYEKNNEKECPICFYEMSTEEIGATSCGHFAHLKCFQEWLNKRGECHMCRSKLEESDLHKLT